jgi:hypothetical protein
MNIHNQASERPLTAESTGTNSYTKTRPYGVCCRAGMHFSARKDAAVVAKNAHCYPSPVPRMD